MGKRLTAAERIQQRAAELVLRGWCQKEPARDQHGRPCNGNDPEAVSFCMASALHRAGRRFGDDARSKSRLAVLERCKLEYDCSAITVTNDSCIRTAQQAAELLWPGSTKGAK